MKTSRVRVKSLGTGVMGVGVHDLSPVWSPGRRGHIPGSWRSALLRSVADSSLSHETKGKSMSKGRERGEGEGMQMKGAFKLVVRPVSALSLVVPLMGMLERV
jgi:hypothetical protein